MSVGMMIYLSEILGGLKIFSAFVAFMLLTAIAVIFFGSEDEISSCAIRWMKNIAYLFVVFLLLAVFIPSEKTMHLITAVRASKEIIGGSPMPEKILRLLNKKLDEELKDSKHE
jgi:hypothetical protein